MSHAALRWVVATAAVGLVALLAALPAESQSSNASSLNYLGQGTNGRFNFYNMDAPGNNPGQAWWIHYYQNPVLPGKNLYAPSAVQNNRTWVVYCGGWRDPTDVNDRIYVTTTQDAELRQGFGPLSLAVDIGYYDAVNDPSVVRRASDLFVMAMTVAKNGNDWIGIATSNDGLSWTPNRVTAGSCEVNFTGGNVTKAGRPSLLYNSSQGRWELYFDGIVDGKYSQFLAYSTERTAPKNFVVQGSVSPEPWFDADIRKVGSVYYALYRRNDQSQPWPWKEWWGTSPDGKSFTEVGVLLAPDPVNAYDAMGVTNGCWVVDNGGTLRGVMFGGTTTTSVNDHKIGIAYPQKLAEAQTTAGVWLSKRQALSATQQSLIPDSTKDVVSTVKLSQPGVVLFDQRISGVGPGANFQLGN